MNEEERVRKEYIEGGLFGSYAISAKLGIPKYKVEKHLKDMDIKQRYYKPRQPLYS